MKCIKRPEFRDFLPEREENIPLHLPAFYRYHLYFHPRLYFLLLWLGGLALSVWQLRFLFLSLGLSLYATYHYYRMQRVARSLYLRRKLTKNRFIEGQEIDWTYEIFNRSPFSSGTMRLRDNLGVCQQPSWERFFPESMPAGSFLRLRMKRRCDGGMGTHNMGPAQIELSDPFGILQFVLQEQNSQLVRVLPEYGRADRIEAETPSFRYQIGNILRASPGRSINFTSIREYQLGDPIGHIAWKLSSRGEDLFVKEFERSTNDSFLLLVDLDPYYHAGDRSRSSFEDCKDIAMAVLKEILAEGHEVQVMTAKYCSEKTRNGDIYEEVAEHLSQWNAFDEQELRDYGFAQNEFAELQEERGNFYQHAARISSPEQKWVCISPFSPERFRILEEELRRQYASQREFIYLSLDMSPYLRYTESHLPQRLSPQLDIRLQDSQIIKEWGQRIAIYEIGRRELLGRQKYWRIQPWGVRT